MAQQTAFTTSCAQSPLTTNRALAMLPECMVSKAVSIRSIAIDLRRFVDIQRAAGQEHKHAFPDGPRV